MKKISPTRSTIEDLSFTPHRLIRHHLLQTVLSVKKPARVERLSDTEQPFLVDAGDDKTGYESSVKLLAYYSPAQKVSQSQQARGLVLMLHGWGGCSHSTYSLVVTDALVNAGYDVVRLNLRDHGPDLHLSRTTLNKGIFLGTLIEEAEAATHNISKLSFERPFFIIGPSMGGNFALRLAIRHTERPIPNLRHVIAISPAINPAAATDALDANLMYRKYFRDMWLGSISEKMSAFPKEFAWLRSIDAHQTVRAMTNWAIPQITDFQSADEYFFQYGVQPENMYNLRVPTTILTAKDDPVIPVQDFWAFPTNPALSLKILDFGGHVGFIDFGTSTPMPSIKHLLPEMISSILDDRIESHERHRERIH